MNKHRNDNLYDTLTGLANKKYVDENYDNYLDTHDDVKIVILDLTKFKKINDSYGHEMGDRCLKVFANKIRNFFSDSIYARLHGDEFIIITALNDTMIFNKLKLVEYSLDREVKTGDIPFNFGFNAGSAPVDGPFEEVEKRADCMMYFAKKNRINYQPYDESIYQSKLAEDVIKNDFNRQLSEKNFTYYGRRLYDINDEKTEQILVHTKDVNGNSFLNCDLYDIIRNNAEIVKFDLYNLQELVEKITNTYRRDDYFINIDYKSLYGIKELLTFFKYIKESTVNGFENIVLSIDITGIETVEYECALDIINLLREYGIKIKMDKVDYRLPDYFLISSNPDFINIAPCLWRTAQESEAKRRLLKSKIKTYQLISNGKPLIFDKIHTQDDKDFILNMCSDNVLLTGNYYSKKKKLTLE